MLNDKYFFTVIPKTHEDYVNAKKMLALYDVKIRGLYKRGMMKFRVVRKEDDEGDYGLAEMAMQMNFTQTSCPDCKEICGHLAFDNFIYRQ